MIRRPHPLKRWDGKWRAWVEKQRDGKIIVHTAPIGLESSKDLRRLADWLYRVADWIDTRRKRVTQGDEGWTP